MTTWNERLTGLLAGTHTTTGDPLDAGAQLVVTNPDGTEAFRAALARHHRTDQDDPQLLWIRPVVGGGPSTSPDFDYAFSLSAARRRSLHWQAAAIDETGDVVLHLVAPDEEAGQTARIQPARDSELEELKRWDTFVDQLDPDEEEALDALEEDSWNGRFA